MWDGSDLSGSSDFQIHSEGIKMTSSLLYLLKLSASCIKTVLAKCGLELAQKWISFWFSV